MGKLFGTDGIRAVANEGLDAPLSYRIGQAAAISLIDSGTQRPRVVIGKDTRISSDMLEAALVAGLRVRRGGARRHPHPGGGVFDVPSARRRGRCYFGVPQSV